MDVELILYSLALLGFILFLGKISRMYIPLFHRYFVPSSIIAGVIGLFLSEGTLGNLMIYLFGEGHFLRGGIISSDVKKYWGVVPEIMITIIFASLFLGQKIPNMKKIWRMAGPQIAFGQTIAWGQYVLGIVVVMLILTPFLNVNPLAGALIEISFQGGPGTAAGLRGTFEKLGYSEGADLALALATFGVITGIISGMIIINWGIRKNKTSIAKKPTNLTSLEKKGIYEKEKTIAGYLTTRSQSIETFTFHFVIICLAIGVGIMLKNGLLLLETYTWGKLYNVNLVEYIPIFPLSMLGGVIIQKGHEIFFNEDIIDMGISSRIQGFALDVLIVTAVSTLSLSIIGDNIIPFLSLAVLGLLWNISAFIILAPRIISPYWFERGVIDFGQSMGMTTTGLLLLQLVDPNKETEAFESFGYKQLLFEPLVGGGLFTAASMPLIAEFGSLAVLIITGSLFAIWLMIGLFYFGKRKVAA